jgi:hypothetical protein
MEIILHSKSSSNPHSPYAIHFVYQDGTLTMRCSCPAGTWGQLCKHKRAFPEGNAKVLHDSNEIDLFKEVLSLIKTTSLPKEYSCFPKREREIEKSLTELKKELSNLKSDFAKKPNIGIA